MSDRAPLIQLSDTVATTLLVATMNSFALDYAARSAIGGTDLSYFILKQLPIPDPDQFQEEVVCGVTYTEFIIPRVLELTYTAHDLAGFADELGYEGAPFRWDDERRFLLRCELDAVFFHMYGLERDEVDYIMDTFPGVEREDNSNHGEYRTKRVILKIYDEMALCRERGYEYQTKLSPPPADPSAAHSVDMQEVD